MVKWRRSQNVNLIFTLQRSQRWGMRSPEGKQEGYFNKRSANEKKRQKQRQRFSFCSNTPSVLGKKRFRTQLPNLFPEGRWAHQHRTYSAHPDQRPGVTQPPKKKPKNGSKEKAKRTMKRIALWNPLEGKKTSNHPKSSKQDGRRKAPPGKGRPRSSLAVPSCRCGV